METLKRAKCCICQRTRYTKYMFLTPLQNKNFDWSYCCNDNKCIKEIKKELQQLVKACTKKVNEAQKLITDIETKERANVNQLTIV